MRHWTGCWRRSACSTTRRCRSASADPRWIFDQVLYLHPSRPALVDHHGVDVVARLNMPLRRLSSASTSTWRIWRRRRPASTSGTRGRAAGASGSFASQLGRLLDASVGPSAGARFGRVSPISSNECWRLATRTSIRCRPTAATIPSAIGACTTSPLDTGRLSDRGWTSNRDHRARHLGGRSQARSV